MVAVALAAARLSRLPDLADGLALPRLTGLERTRQRESTLVQFAGDTLPTSFRGEAGSRTWTLTCQYLDGEHAKYLALLDLLERAQDDVDDRLLLRTYVGQVAGLDGAHIVTVPEWTQTPGDGGLTWSVTFTATAVAGSLAV